VVEGTEEAKEEEQPERDEKAIERELTRKANIDFMHKKLMADFEKKVDRAIKLNNHKWIPDEFQQNENRINFEFKWLGNIKGLQDTRKCYAAICQFLRESQRPVDVRNNSLRYYDYFGVDGYVEADLKRLVDLSINLQAFKKRLEYLPERDSLKDAHLFDQFLEVCKTIQKRLGKHCLNDESD
jgi:hypothetical protein